MPSPSINLIKSSDGTGNAAMATVQSTRAPGASTILVDTVDNIPATFYGSMGTPHTFVDPITAETITVISEATSRDFEGHVDGTNLEIDAMAPGNIDLGSTAGDVIIIKPTTEWANNIATTFGVAHNDDGSLKAVVSNQGWTDVTGTTVTSVTANGNRSYDVGVDQDLRTVLSPGMRLRTTRTVAAPTQCTSLNGTTQYYSKTTPAGMTFTDDFVAGAWVKLSSYQTGTIISRFNGTSGWAMDMLSNGQIRLVGYNAGAGNYSLINTHQSLPLNKWVHVTAQLDMSAFTATTTTSYVMFDGVDVPSFVGRGGTNPTALVQAGNLEIGTQNTISFWSGKIAQAFVSSAKITQANIKTLYSQGLTASLISTHSIISAYSFDNAITDLNTTSANNLTANGSAVATNADSPFGGQADGTISSTLDHAIIQKVTASTITVQVAEGCTIPTSGGVSALSYATVKSPYGFPGQEDKWTICTRLRTNNATTSNATYGNFISGGWAIYVPVGAWTVGYDIASYSLSITTTTFNLSPTSLVGVAEGTTENIQYSHRNGGASTNLAYYSGVRRIQELVTTAKTYVMYSVGATTSAGVGGAVEHSELIAINAYL